MCFREFFLKGIVMAITMNLAINVLRKNFCNKVLLNLLAIVSISTIWGYPMGCLIGTLIDSTCSFSNNIILFVLYTFFVYCFLIVLATLFYIIFYNIWGLEALESKQSESMFIIIYLLSIAIWAI